ncbi:MAG TPA: SRPBCC family protein [Chitinophagaceae bacterium]|nr:SRPBCC family protein [Chitinophagaceae bacterium]HPH33339.1 SRPBCC family protein [Chitinophagaceae bacterium]HPN60082.1 SRPBCC family protein [Chitinophagaceae bacterium]
MRLIKLAFISFFVFFLLITGISLFFPSHVRISKAIDINAPRDSVRAMISQPLHWKNWYPGADTLALYEADGVIKGIRMPGNQVLMITGFNDSTVMAANSSSGTERASMGWNLIQSNPKTVTVQWYMDFKLRWYPWEKFSSLLLEKRYGPVMEQGLAKLKTTVQATP